MTLELTITQETDKSYYTVTNNCGHTYSMWGEDITKVEFDDESEIKKVVLTWCGESRDLTISPTDTKGMIIIKEVLGVEPESLEQLRTLLSDLRL